MGSTDQTGHLGFRPTDYPTVSIMPESAKKVLEEITAAGLLSADQATKFDREIETGVEALLSRLVEEQHITAYQAEKFREGKASDITFGDYLVMEKLGQGGMGTVLLARHRRMDREVAIKILPVTALDSEAAVARFYQEVKVAAQLTHPNIVHAYDAGEHHGFHYLVMEYVKGHDLARVLQQIGPVPVPMAIDYIMQAAQGLEYAHRKGVVHRDIKPSNLLLDDEGKIKILDMGLARIGGTGLGDASMHLTTTGQVMGTVEYMSPEQAEDTRAADARSDIYSLGCTLFRLITGEGPFSRDTVVKTILAHRDAEIPSLLGHTGNSALDTVFRKMVAKNPTDRYQSTMVMIEALRGLDDSLDQDYSQPQPGQEEMTIAPGTGNIEPTMPPSQPGVPFSDGVEVSPGTHASPTPAGYLDPTRLVNPESIRSGAPHAAPPGSGQYYPPPPSGYVPANQPYGMPYPYMKRHRGKTLMFMGILGIVFSMCIIGTIPAIMAWVYANGDLNEMQQNMRDPAGMNMTKTAKILGMVGVGISAIVVVGGILFS